MTEQKHKTWDDIWENDELLANLWNQFIKEDAEVAKEAEDYGEKYMKVYPNTYEGILQAYNGYVDNFIKDNMSFWQGSGSDGYSLVESWFIINITTSEEEYASSDDSVLELIELMIMNQFGESQDSPIMERFKQFCIEHQDEFKEKEA